MTNPNLIAPKIISLLDMSGLTIGEKHIALDIAKILCDYVPKFTEETKEREGSLFLTNCL